MSPPKDFLQRRDEIRRTLTVAQLSTERAYHSKVEIYLSVANEFRQTPDDPEAVRAVYRAARDVSIAQRRHRRASKVLNGFKTA